MTHITLPARTGLPAATSKPVRQVGASAAVLHDLDAVWWRTGMTVVFITHSVEEAVYLGTEVVVVSPRPGRIVERIPVPFARDMADAGIRAMKSDPDFVATPERVLLLIWGMRED